MVWMIDKNTHINKGKRNMDSPEHSKIVTIQDEFDRLNSEIENLTRQVELYKTALGHIAEGQSIYKDVARTVLSKEG